MIVGRKHSYPPLLLLAVLTIASAFLASGCLWGVVTDASTGAPVQGATVHLDGRTTTTNAHGWYAFDSATGPLPPAGGFAFMDVIAPGYAPLTKLQKGYYVWYLDNPNANPANPSSFWEIINFNLTPLSALPLAADLAVTDLYLDHKPQGTLYAGITNNGPDSLSNVSVQLSCGGERTEWASGTKSPLGGGGVILPLTLTLNPGKTKVFSTTIAFDTAKYWYDPTCGVVVTFTDTDPSNNYYSEIIPNPAPNDDLRVTEIYLTKPPASPNQVAVRVYAPPASSLSGSYKYELYADGTLIAQENRPWPNGSTYFYTGYYVTGTQSIRVVLDVGNKFPEIDETNNEMTRTCSSASHSCGSGGNIL